MKQAGVEEERDRDRVLHWKGRTTFILGQILNPKTTLILGRREYIVVLELYYMPNSCTWNISLGISKKRFKNNSFCSFSVDFCKMFPCKISYLV